MAAQERRLGSRHRVVLQRDSRTQRGASDGGGCSKQEQQVEQRLRVRSSSQAADQQRVHVSAPSDWVCDQVARDRPVDGTSDGVGRWREGREA